jgi:hypothetical protein
VLAITATVDYGIAQYQNGVVEAWSKDFDVEWRFEANRLNRTIRVIGDKVVLTDMLNEAVIHDMKTHRTTTIIDKGIGGMNNKYAEIAPRKVTLNITKVSTLRPPVCTGWC